MSGDGEVKPLFLLSDEPIGSHGDDRLGMDSYRDVITGAVLGTVGPFTIGVYGRWGEGKTSLLRAAESRLRAVVSEAGRSSAAKPGEPEFPYVVPVWFNPWRYEREEHPLIPLVAEIERAVRKALDDDKKILARYNPITVTALKGVSLAALSLLRAVSVKGGIKGGIGPVVAGSVEVGLDGSNLADGLEKAWEKLHTQEQSAWRELVERSTYLTIFDHLKGVYSGLDLTRPGAERRIPRVAVFIDDLDRCQADKAFELIESIKLVLGQKGFVFVLALDKAVVDSYVLTRMRKQFDERTDAATPFVRVLAERYLDKIVQLPLHLRDHERSFAPYVDGLVGKMKAGGVPSETLAVFEGISPHLGLATNHSPRALVRRINTLLVDQRLRPPADKSDHKDVKDLTPAEFLGLCLVQRTLLDHVDHTSVVEFARDDDFCKFVAVWWRKERARGGPKGGEAAAPNPVAAAFKALDAIRDQASGTASPEAAGRPKNPDESPPPEHARWRSFLVKFDPYPACKYVLGTEHGERWLGSRALRDLVAGLVATRPAEAPADTPELREQVAIFERAVRTSLNLAAEAPLSPAEWGAVKSLNLSGQTVTDAGAAWLADPRTGLKALTTLQLADAKVTDDGVKALADARTGLKALTSLGLWDTKVTDEGVKALADARTGVKALTSLDLSWAKVTDEGVKALADARTGLKGLTSLDLSWTKVTDEGVRALADAQTGLKALTTLRLGSTGVTDEGVKALADAQSGLKALTALFLLDTRVTGEGAQALTKRFPGIKIIPQFLLDPPVP